MKKTAILLAGLVFTAPALAEDVKAGKEVAAVQCAACHGINGISMAPVWPNLANQKAQYIVIQLQNFKKGERKNGIMEPIAQKLSAADMDNVAAYYASIK